MIKKGMGWFFVVSMIGTPIFGMQHNTKEEEEKARRRNISGTPVADLVAGRKGTVVVEEKQKNSFLRNHLLPENCVQLPSGDIVIIFDEEDDNPYFPRLRRYVSAEEFFNGIRMPATLRGDGGQDDQA